MLLTDSPAYGDVIMLKKCSIIIGSYYLISLKDEIQSIEVVNPQQGFSISWFILVYLTPGSTFLQTILLYMVSKVPSLNLF